MARSSSGAITRFFAMTAALLLALLTPAVAETVNTVTVPRVYIMDCGVLLYNSLAAFGYKPGEVSPTNLTDACYLIVHPTKGTLLWDTGAVADHLWKEDGIPPKVLYAEGTVRLDRQLAQIGYKPSDITYVAVSHAHWDHVSNLYQFAADTWITSKYTRDKLLSANPPDKTDPSMFRDLANMRKIIVPDEGDYDVFGDGSVTMIPVPGHTPDSRVLLVKLKNTGPVILAGDLYHFVADIESKNMTRGDDRPANLTSRAKIEALRDALSAQIWIPHDFMQFSRLAKSPHFYD